MTGTFAIRITELMGRTHAGGGELDGSVEVSQVYAHAQHEHLDWSHPRGGGPKYLEGPLFARYGGYLAAIAAGYLDDGGTAAMTASMEDLSDQVAIHAPVEFDMLRRSGHPSVRRGVALVYDRPPYQSRLPDSVLDAESRMNWPSLPAALKGWIYWHFTARGRAGRPPPGSGWRG